jgi:hypothetical protein
MTALTAAHLLRLELALVLTFAFLFLAIPNTATRIFGLPLAGSAFWPRLVGGLFLGIGMAVIATDQGWTTLTTEKGVLATGMGLGAFVAVNLTLAFVLMSMLVAGNAAPTRRGTWFLWMLAILLALLGFVQIAFVR